MNVDKWINGNIEKPSEKGTMMKKKEWKTRKEEIKWRISQSERQEK